MYPQNTKVVGNNGVYGAFKANGGETSNIARWLKAAPTPYRTGMIGKYLNGYRPANDQGQVIDGKPNAGFDYWFGVGHDAYDGDTFWAWDDYKVGGAGIVQYGSQHLDHPENYLTNVLSTKALQFLGNAATAQPFFLVVTPMAPHSPSNPLDAYLDLYDGETYPRGPLENPSFNEPDVSDKPYYVSMLPLLEQPQIDLIDERYGRRLECMESVADLVVAVVDKLAEVPGRLENTYVFFTSDHGFHMGEHRLGQDTFQGAGVDDEDPGGPGGKNSMYEEDIRVPLWIRHPSINVQTVDKLIGNVDLAPTFRHIAGMTPTPVPLDGRSFLPLLHGQSPPWRTQYLISRGQTKTYAGIRHANEWVFGELDFPAELEIPGEYYENLDDPDEGRYELDNDYNGLGQQRLNDLRTLVYNYRHCQGNNCRIYDKQTI